MSTLLRFTNTVLLAAIAVFLFLIVGRLDNISKQIPDEPIRVRGDELHVEVMSPVEIETGSTPIPVQIENP
ncbi:MAG: hypothetical protein ACREIF_08180 [Chthoniobacterales bacterium]